jgi:hypothetical protein
MPGIILGDYPQTGAYYKMTCPKNKPIDEN